VVALPDLPDGWAWTSVEEARSSEPNSVTDGPFGSNLKTEHYTESGPRVVRLQNIGDGHFVDAMAHIAPEHFARLSKHHIFAGDIIIAALGETLPRACVVPENIGPALVKADCIRLLAEPALTSASYLNTVLNAEPTRIRVTSTVHGVGRPRLNLGEVKAIKLPLPPLAEQERIVAEVERRLSVLDQLDAAVTTNLKRSDALRQSVLRRAFTGTLV